MKNLGKRTRYKIQRRLNCELPGLGKAGALERKPYPPGEHGNKRRKYSDYAIHLEEKQKVLFHYGIREKQLRRFIRDSKSGAGKANWVENLIGKLERRLDNVIFRLGFAPSMLAARQLINHKKVLVNGQRVDIGSAVLKVGDVIQLRPKVYESQVYLQCKDKPRLDLPDYLEKKEENGIVVGVVKDTPKVEHVPFPFDPGIFTEYYSLRNV